MALTFWGKTFSPVYDAMPSSDAMPRLDAPEVSAGGGCQFPPLMMGRGENVWSSVGFFSVRIVSPDGHAARYAPSLTHNFSSKVIPKSDKANEKNPP